MQSLLNFLIILIFSQLTTSYVPCVDQCINDNNSPSWCQGDELGRKGTQCLCRHLDSTPLIECIRNCSPSDQWDFAGGLPQHCRDGLFPDAQERQEDSSGADSVTLGSGPPLRVLGGLGAVVLTFVFS
ncbi:hypothetical protein BDW60DRAFT_76298 [Aspergillus nidulans var. acristatus]